MSKHKNYSKYSNPSFNPIIEVTPMTEPEVIEPEVKMESEVSENSIANEVTVNEVTEVQVMQMSPVEEAVPEIPAVGKVVDCSRLNVRVSPAVNTNVVTTLVVGTEVEIDLDKSTDEWYCVFINNGNATGYCMKKFISVNV